MRIVPPAASDGFNDSSDAAASVLAALFKVLPVSEHASLALSPAARSVPLCGIEDSAWLTEQMRLHQALWRIEDPHSLATLWWYLVAPWAVGPTVVSLVAGTDILSADVADLEIHILPDGRITGATSHRVLAGSDRIESAAASIRNLYEQVVPVLAEYGQMRERPLWAIAADALANRLLWLGRATQPDLAGVHRVTGLLEPLSRAIGDPLPVTRYSGTGNLTTMHTRRCSCCLIYRTPGGSMCASCPRGGDRRRKS